MIRKILPLSLTLFRDKDGWNRKLLPTYIHSTWVSCSLLTCLLTSLICLSVCRSIYLPSSLPICPSIHSPICPQLQFEKHTFIWGRKYMKLKWENHFNFLDLWYKLTSLNINSIVTQMTGLYIELMNYTNMLWI